MNQPARTAHARRIDSLTLLALAAGLAFGHMVAAMAEGAALGGATIVIALVFLGAASAGTVCGLAAFAARQQPGRAHERVAAWVFALGAGVFAALGPGLI